jgi:hypothetical protein
MRGETEKTTKNMYVNVRGTILKILYSHMPWETEKYMKNLSQDIRWTGGDLNWLFREHRSKKVTACVKSLGDAESTKFRSIR